MVKFYTRQSLHTTTQLLQGSSKTRAKIWSNYTQDKVYIPVELEPKFGQIIHTSGTRAKIWSNYTQNKVYIPQHSYSKAPVKQEPKFGQIIHKTKSTYHNTATPRLQKTRAKIWSNYTQDKVYIPQHSYSKAPVKQEQKFGQIIHKTKSTYQNTATSRLQ